MCLPLNPDENYSRRNFTAGKLTKGRTGCFGGAVDVLDRRLVN